MGLITLLAAATESHSYTLFYVVGGLFAGFAVIVSAVGLARGGAPGSGTGALIGVGTLLAAGSMAAAVYVTS